MLTTIQKAIVNIFPEKIRQNLYVPLSNIPLLSFLLKRYIEKTSPVCLVSFKKTGRTWLNVLIGKALQLHFQTDEVDILDLPSREDIKQGFPGIIFLHDDTAHWKTPDELTWSKSKYKFKKVILLVRDPRDAVVSVYFEKTKRLPAYIEGEKHEYPAVKNRIEPYHKDISNFIREPVGSLDTIIQFYNIWAQNRHILGDRLLLVRYEDVQASPQKELRRIMDFIGFANMSNQVIDEAVDYAAFSKMKEREEKNASQSIKVRAADLRDEDSYKTRKGKVGGFVDYLSAEDIRYLNAKVKKELSSFYGYDI